MAGLEPLADDRWVMMGARMGDWAKTGGLEQNSRDVSRGCSRGHLGAGKRKLKIVTLTLGEDAVLQG